MSKSFVVLYRDPGADPFSTPNGFMTVAGSHLGATDNLQRAMPLASLAFVWAGSNYMDALQAMEAWEASQIVEMGKWLGTHGEAY